MKKNEIGEKILLTIYDLTETVGNIFSRDSLWMKIQKMGNAPTRREFVTSLNSLKRSQFWKISRTGKYRLTNKGLARLGQLNLQRSFKNKKWDGLWRLVIFDISEDKKIAREALRRKLKKFGFYHLQKSVFVFPHDCEKEIMALTDFFEAKDNIEYIIAKDLGYKEREIKDFFELD